ncbi:Panacea domain-containing protein [Mesorhizobium sp. M7A.F.Ca.US.008.03.1.1]|uniref:Panacea domain-containing protein n=1 Tax=Mesorhizobium sp. M7A.F.Ca.US.008.03.1.1 TaxID=2496742 RepID=UPI000FCB520B|nr:Panacea domain-containing protein [Mesorhizobium sp. M7A.F.Ca.US.008.03.1.1]RUW60178.1 DUF4065 domain-containing protein [Mesorhizobium sp. M7A.F.Ca.US.008.03.1.1]
MIVTHEREKLIQAISFFALHTRKLGKTKLFKLLYFLDFEHFKQTGRSVTGLTYNAWPKGPVPVALYNEIEAPSDDLAAAIQFEKKEIQNGEMLTVTPKRVFSSDLFSAREMRLLRGLAQEFKDKTADEMVEATHLENMPWDQIYNKEGKKQAEIPYALAVRSDEREDVLRVAKERKELLESLSDESGIGIF